MRFFQDEIVIGTLTPILWDQQGNIKKFSIYTLDEEDFIIEDYTNPKRLKTLLNKRVQAYGLIGTNKDDCKVIYVNKLVELDKDNSSLLFMNPARDKDIWNEEFSVHIPIEYPSFNEPLWEAS